MVRVTKGGKTCLVGYHAQEFRPTSQPLSGPIRCKGKNAWLGVGYYFWTELDFAHFWGTDFKRDGTGFYDIYQGDVVIDNCINTVFDEDGYFFFREKIEETIRHFKEKGFAVSLEKIHRFLADNIWPKLGVEGIIYDDKPKNSTKTDRIHSEIPELYYKKRIQVMVFDRKNILNFEIILEEQDGSYA